MNAKPIDYKKTLSFSFLLSITFKVKWHRSHSIEFMFDTLLVNYKLPYKYYGYTT